MSAETVLVTNYGQIGRLVAMLRGMVFKPGRALKIELQWVEPKGTAAQMALIRVKVAAIARHSGYDKDELYEGLLATKYGTRRVEVLRGCFIEKPAKRVSDMDKAERARYIDWLDQVGRDAGAWA